jgi:hypothetical protein
VPLTVGLRVRVTLGDTLRVGLRLGDKEGVTEGEDAPNDCVPLTLTVRLRVGLRVRVTLGDTLRVGLRLVEDEGVGEGEGEGLGVACARAARGCEESSAPRSSRRARGKEGGRAPGRRDTGAR